MKYLKIFTALCVLLVAGAATADAQQSFNTVLPKPKVMKIVVDEAVRYDVPPELALAVARVESNFKTHAVSSKGARGVMQIMPKTARDEFDTPAHRLFDTRTNVRLGVKFLKQLLKMYGGQTEYALSHYNGGSRVRRGDGTMRVIPATRGYVNKVLAQQARYRRHHLVLATASPNAVRRSFAVTALDDFDNPYSRLNRHTRWSHDSVDETISSAWIGNERRKLVENLRSLKHKNRIRFASDTKASRVGELAYHDSEPMDWNTRREKVRQWEAY
jgi:hypothetical protein